MNNLDILMHFGLTRTEAVLYATLLEQGAQTGYELAKRTGVSRSNAYTALAGLVDKGAADLMEGAPARYAAVPAGDFCEAKLRALRALMQQLSLPEAAQPTDGYLTVSGRAHALDRLRAMLNRARLRVYLSAGDLALMEVLSELQDAVTRGLKVVIVTSAPFALPGAQVYHTQKEAHSLRAITDSACALTGDLNGDAACLYSQKQTLVELVKDAIRSEITLVTLTGAPAL